VDKCSNKTYVNIWNKIPASGEAQNRNKIHIRFLPHLYHTECFLEAKQNSILQHIDRSRRPQRNKVIY